MGGQAQPRRQDIRKDSTWKPVLTGAHPPPCSVLTSPRPVGQENPEPTKPICRGSGLGEATGDVQAATSPREEGQVSLAQQEGGSRVPTRAGCLRAAWRRATHSRARTPSLPHASPACAPRLCPLLSTAARGRERPWDAGWAMLPSERAQEAAGPSCLDAPGCQSLHFRTRQLAPSLLLPPPLPGRGKIHVPSRESSRNACSRG